jgi:hypothetical protein
VIMPSGLASGDDTDLPLTFHAAAAFAAVSSTFTASSFRGVFSAARPHSDE